MLMADKHTSSAHVRDALQHMPWLSLAQPVQVLWHSLGMQLPSFQLSMDDSQLESHNALRRKSTDSTTLTFASHSLRPFVCIYNTDVAESIGRELLVYGRRIPKAEMFARIDAVDADTVRAVADRFIYDQDVAIAAVGDTQFLPDYNW
jgi:hypothetical protein